MKIGTMATVVALVFIMLLITFQYQRPVMTSGEALIQAVAYLQDLPEDYHESMRLHLQVEELQREDYFTSLNLKRGFLSELLNRRQWEVTIKYDGMEPTVVMDAITGKFITIYGPLN